VAGAKQIRTIKDFSRHRRDIEVTFDQGGGAFPVQQVRQLARVHRADGALTFNVC
jgi:hypothetical protein